MRFHMGFSFRLKDLRKFIIPFLLGILAYFGFGLIANVHALDEPIEESSEESTITTVDLPQDVYVVNDSPYVDGLGEYIFWFQEPNSSSDVLVNIYIILFIYCIGMITLKFITYIHDVKWGVRK